MSNLFPWHSTDMRFASFAISTALNCVHLAAYTAVVTVVVKVIA